MNTRESFINGIFGLRTRRFGSIAEIMIKRIYHLEDSNTLAYDKLDSNNNKRIEIKFSTVMKSNSEKIDETNAIDQCLKADVVNRAMHYNEISDNIFDCNIQQVKCIEFDVLYYGLFFADKILIFKMLADEVKKSPGYSNKQHRNNEGEGQFYINNKTINYHIENHLEMVLTYDELFNILK